jgi:hypothetical protein
LADDAPPIGTKGGADGELALSHRGARQKKIGDVGASYYKDEGNRTKQDQQGWLDVADRGFA